MPTGLGVLDHYKGALLPPYMTVAYVSLLRVNTREGGLLEMPGGGGSRWDLPAAVTDPILIPNLDQVNPPLNVTAGVEGTRLSVQWDKPISAFPTHCFEYEVKIHNARKGYFQVMLQTALVFDGSLLLGTFLKSSSMSALVTARN